MKRKREVRKLSVEVDVSGQLSDTKDTVFAFSNGDNYSILVPGRTKRVVLKIYRSSKNRAKDFPLHFYLAGIRILIKSSGKKFTRITLDRELVGHEKRILNFLRREVAIGSESDGTLFEIRQIGRESRAHLKAKGVYNKKNKAERVVKLSELLKCLNLE